MHDEVERVARTGDVGSKAAFVAHRGRQALFRQALLERVENLRAPAHRFGKAVRADRHDHEFLDIDRIVGMLAAVDDIHHRDRQHVRGDAADIGPQRHATRSRRSLGDRQAGAEDSIRAKLRLVRRTVEIEHHCIDIALIFGVEAQQRVGDRRVDRIDRPCDALAEITPLIAIAQLDRFMRAGRSARRHRGAPEAAVFEKHVHFDGRIAPAIEDLAGMQVDDGGHGVWLRLLDGSLYVLY
ncbi:probable phosphopyruvate hydratase [Erythrobacter litoralis HTCC2594]|uniref:Probable phosphopyruvate hydratase n=1 Tax=Erythrobacter litoralis (strain HTCC2594) TaxID=314225 RepID=Q2NAQ2_ERYLH|nr:probable phosphopyruvate hydratase [Erythrobacter litoralis HTCC2594]